MKATAAPDGQKLQRWVYAAVGLTLAAVAALPTSWLTSFFTNPIWMRRDTLSLGGVEMSSLLLLRVLAPSAGLALIALAWWGDRLAGRSAANATFTPAAPAPTAPADKLVLAGAMLLAMIVRAPLLQQSLWYDEIAAFLGYGVHGPGAAMGSYYTQANHVLQSVLSWASASALGASEYSLRLPALLAGLALVPTVWWLGREAGSVVAARFAAFAVALMPVAVLESTEARGYSMMALFAALATASLLRAVRTKSGLAWALYAVVCALGVWSHLVTVVVPAFHFGWALAAVQVDRRTRLAAVTSVGVAALLTAALLSPLLGDMFALRKDFTVVEGNEPSLLSAQGIMALSMLGGSFGWLAALAAAPLLGAAVACLMDKDARGLRRAVLLSVGPAVILALVPLLGSWVYARFFTFLVPGVALLLGAGAAYAWARNRSGAWALCGLAAGGWVTSLVLLPPRQALRESVAYIAQHKQKDERAIAIGLPDDVQQWYAAEHEFSIPGSGPYGADLAARLASDHPRWILMLYPRAQPASTLERVRAEGFTVAQEFPGWIDDGDGRIVVWRR